MQRVRQNAAIYFLLQGLAVFVWWIMLYFIPESRNLFRLGNDGNTLLAFWLPDLILLAGGSFAVSFALAFSKII